MERGDCVQEAEAIQSLIDRIVCLWARVPTEDKRFKDGYRTVCDQVDVYAADGEIVTIEGTPKPNNRPFNLWSRVRQLGSWQLISEDRARLPFAARCFRIASPPSDAFSGGSRQVYLA